MSFPVVPSKTVILSPTAEAGQTTSQLHPQSVNRSTAVHQASTLNTCNGLPTISLVGTQAIQPYIISHCADIGFVNAHISLTTSA